MPALTSPKRSPKKDSNSQIAEALLACAQGLNRIGTALERLGSNGAAGPEGAVEFLAVQMKEGLKDAGDSIAEAIRHKD